VASARRPGRRSRRRTGRTTPRRCSAVRRCRPARALRRRGGPVAAPGVDDRDEGERHASSRAATPARWSKTSSAAGVEQPGPRHGLEPGRLRDARDVDGAADGRRTGPGRHPGAGSCRGRGCRSGGGATCWSGTPAAYGPTAGPRRLLNRQVGTPRGARLPPYVRVGTRFEQASPVPPRALTRTSSPTDTTPTTSPSGAARRFQSWSTTTPGMPSSLSAVALSPTTSGTPVRRRRRSPRKVPATSPSAPARRPGCEVWRACSCGTATGRSRGRPCAPVPRGCSGNASGTPGRRATVTDLRGAARADRVTGLRQGRQDDAAEEHCAGARQSGRRTACGDSLASDVNSA
jgi:hypothetical protein